ncbi:MAG: 1,4-alpha-glucan branching protein GlgB [Pirellulales bacterium]|nr:1,4-alpha-glucan branching protein GlgB [Pirellulales bacterium]
MDPGADPRHPSHSGIPGDGRETLNFSILDENDLYLFNEGTHLRLYEKLGAHRIESGGRWGTFFAVWAPDAREVSVIGDFNGWNRTANRLHPRGVSGIWEGFIPGVEQGARYKYWIVSRQSGFAMDKADPLAFAAETPPATASVVCELYYSWNDRAWMENRYRRNALGAPISIYEVHLGSWMLAPEGREDICSYRGAAARLVEYVRQLGFTHVEFLPLMEHPFYGSWGYQTSAYFAPTRRYGTPQDLMYLVDYLHQHDIGVILDWVPSHFVTDAHGLGLFDGTHLYEHADPRQGLHPDWNTYIFNYGRNEVRSFLLSSALFWLDQYHADGLRVDAVASMLYLDYSRKEGEWIPNAHGGRENLAAISFLRQLNELVYRHHPDVLTVAEESTAWPKVSRPVYDGGLGFGYKWDMGWMHDTLEYLRRDPIHRKHHHNQITFRSVYAASENFVLPLSHDEVVHGKGSLLERMPGDDWQKFANLRLLLGSMYAQPGKKLLFMGSEFGQRREWNHDDVLDWELLAQAPHQGLQKWVEDLNRLYRTEPALHDRDCHPEGFRWVDGSDAVQSVLCFLRRGREPDQDVLVVCNFTPVPRTNYRVGVVQSGFWKELLNSDAPLYGGSGQGNIGGTPSAPIPCHNYLWSLNLVLPPLAILFLKMAK